MTETAYDWSLGNDAVVAGAQPATAIYTNGYGTIVLRQEAGPLDSEDTFAIVSPFCAGAIAAALLREAGHADLADFVDQSLAPRPIRDHPDGRRAEERPGSPEGKAGRTGAARSAAYRARRRSRDAGLATRDARAVTRDGDGDAQRDRRDAVNVTSLETPDGERGGLACARLGDG